MPSSFNVSLFTSFSSFYFYYLTLSIFPCILSSLFLSSTILSYIFLSFIQTFLRLSYFRAFSFATSCIISSHHTFYFTLLLYFIQLIAFSSSLRLYDHFYPVCLRFPLHFPRENPSSIFLLTSFVSHLPLNFPSNQ